MNTRTLLASAIALGLLAACSKPEPVVESPRPVVVFTLAPAHVAPIALYTGEVRARYESDLAFRIGGKIVERRVDLGAVVKPGQVLARLDPADAGLNAEAAPQLAAAENEFAYARAEVLRYRDLVAKNFVSRSVLDAKETAFRSATARVEQAGWSGMVMPYKTGYTFSPVSKSYSNVQSGQTSQNYTATACVGCADVNVTLGGTSTGNYTLPSGGMVYPRYGLNGRTGARPQHEWQTQSSPVNGRCSATASTRSWGTPATN